MMNDTTNNGGPAFPSGIVRKSRPAHDPGADFHVTDFTEPRNAGMTLRDYFAAKAMHQFLYGAVLPVGFDASDQLEMLAARAYEMADAMLKARGQA